MSQLSTPIYISSEEENFLTNDIRDSLAEENSDDPIVWTESQDTIIPETIMEDYSDDPIVWTQSQNTIVDELLPEDHSWSDSFEEDMRRFNYICDFYEKTGKLIYIPLTK